MYGKRFETELKMIDDAIATHIGRKVLQDYLKSEVERVIEEYVCSKHRGYDLPRESLRKAAWSHFNTALIRYRGRTELMLKGKNNVFYFITYFRWYVRLGIKDHIEGLLGDTTSPHTTPPLS